MEEIGKVLCRGILPLHRNMNVLHAQRGDSSRFVLQRISWIVVQGEINDDLEAFVGDKGKIRFAGLPRGGQIRRYPAQVLEVGENVNHAG